MARNRQSLSASDRMKIAVSEYHGGGRIALPKLPWDEDGQQDFGGTSGPSNQADGREAPVRQASQALAKQSLSAEERDRKAWSGRGAADGGQAKASRRHKVDAGRVSEAEYGRLWRMMSAGEGHKAKLPPTILSIQEKARIQNGRESQEQNLMVLKVIKKGERVNGNIIKSRLPKLDEHVIKRTLYRLANLELLIREPVRAVSGKVRFSYYYLNEDKL